jgi:ABC-type transport system involved in cytochrome c biogenesis ATPase subunit
MTSSEVDDQEASQEQLPPSTLGHLKEITVRGLFDTRNYTFQLDLKEPTLLTGSNGTGKSTILRIINAIGVGTWFALWDYPIRSLGLFFESGTTLTVEKVEPRILKVTLNGEHFDIDRERIDFVWDDEIVRRLMPELHKLSSGRFGDSSGNILTREEVTEKILSRGYAPMPGESQALDDFVQAFPLLYITDQRLTVSEERLAAHRLRAVRTPIRGAADLSARELAREMQNALSHYASQSQRLDRDFPNRVVRAMALASEEEVPIDRIRELLRDVERDREELQKVGLLPRDLSADAFRDLPLNDPHVRPVIETFVKDTKEKFAVLADLREQLTLFTDFLNQHYENKRVVATAGHGFRVEIDGDPDKAILPSQLSSGEQQILVLAHEVLFKAQPGTLVLIDEPELSLHVVWQDTFIDDLSRMGTVRDLQFILATHSPSLIGGREDLKRSLDVPQG